MNKLCVCVVLSALLVVASQVRATPERALTQAETWSTYGGAGGMCKTGWGWCYVDPSWNDCNGHDQEVCAGKLAVRSVRSGVTCVNSPYELEFNCTELGPQLPCVESATCFWRDLGEGFGSCMEDELSWEDWVGGPRSGAFGVVGDDCY